MKRGISQVSGATLGYITGNLPGAVAGYNLAGQAYDYMQTPVSGHKRGRSRSRSHGTRRSSHSRGRSHSSRSRSRAMSDVVTGHAHPSQALDQEMIERYHPIARFEHKKTRFAHVKHKTPKTLKGKIKKEIKKAQIKMSPPCQIMEYRPSGLDVEKFLPTSTSVIPWETTPFQTMTFANLNNGLRFLTGGVNILGATTTTELARPIEQSQAFPQMVGLVGATASNTIGTASQSINGNANMKAIQQDKYQNKYYLSSFEADINLLNTNTTEVTYEIYELQAQRNMTATDAFKDVATAVESCIKEVAGEISGSQRNVSLENWRGGFGNMLEDVPNLWKHWKIINRTRIKLPSGDSTAIQFKGPHKQIIDWHKVREFCTIRHMTTEFVIVVGNGPCPGLLKTNTDNGTFTVQTRIKYRFMDSNSAQHKIPLYTIHTV